MIKGDGDFEGGGGREKKVEWVCKPEARGSFL